MTEAIDKLWATLESTALPVGWWWLESSPGRFLLKRPDHSRVGLVWLDGDSVWAVPAVEPPWERYVPRQGRECAAVEELVSWLRRGRAARRRWVAGVRLVGLPSPRRWTHGVPQNE